MRDKHPSKFYNLIFPLWYLWAVPLAWVVVLPANFIIDLLVIVLTMKYLKLSDIISKAESVILSVWICGFLSDLIGAAFMLLGSRMDFRDAQIGAWWADNISNAISYCPFQSIYSILWITMCVHCFAFDLLHKLSYLF